MILESSIADMKLCMVGMGRMGSNMARRLARAGHEIIVYDHNLSRLDEMQKEKFVIVKTLAELLDRLESKRIVWLMLPAGQVTDEVVENLSHLLKPEDIIIDGGNSHYRDDVRRSKSLQSQRIHYLDVGVSGGVWGLERGYCQMIGGEKQVALELSQIFEALAPGGNGIPDLRTAEKGYLYCGPAGAGHFAKMIHNGIEYGMMQAFAEGFDILNGSPYSFDLADLAEVWRRGSVVSSWLLDLIAIALKQDPELTQLEGHVPDSGEGRWAVQAAVDAGVPAEVLSAALNVRFRSRNMGIFSQKLLSAMRREFGGHAEASSGDLKTA